MHVFFGRRPEGGVGAVSGAAAWFLGALSTLEDLRPVLTPLQFRLAADVICQWARVIPWTMIPGGAEGAPVIVTEEQAGKFCELFDTGEVTTRLVRIFRTLLPHHADHMERDAAVLQEMIVFCTERSDAVSEYRRHGAFSVERFLLDRYAWHCGRLLRTVLGDDHFDRYVVGYNAVMRDLREQVDVLSKPAN